MINDWERRKEHARWRDREKVCRRDDAMRVKTRITRIQTSYDSELHLVYIANNFFSK